MKLFIDTRDREKIVVGIGEKRFEAKSKDGASQRLLPFIDEVLASQGVTLRNITEIELNTGPGSFTGLRVGVSVANTLGWVLRITVNGKDISKKGSVDINY